MPTPVISTSIFCTDEDILVACPGDFAQLIPVSQVLAQATDGVFAAAAGGSWVLSSASVPFFSIGISPGHVVQLRAPQATFPSAVCLVVDSVGANSVTLRRAGLPASFGQPIGPAAGLTAVGFLIGTLYPQIERASYDLFQQFHLDDNVSGLTFSDLYDSRQLRDACVSLVLSRQYLDMARHVVKSEDFAAKAKVHSTDFDQTSSRITVTMATGTAGGEQLISIPHVTR